MRGDVVTVASSAAPSLAGLYRVGSGGDVALPGGPLAAAGRTFTELADAIAAREHVDDVTVTPHVRIEGRVAIAGEVRRPGLLALAPVTSLQHALEAAGGTTAWADPRRIEVVREIAGRARRMRIPLRDAPSFALEPGDEVVVPTVTLDSRMPPAPRY